MKKIIAALICAVSMITCTASAFEVEFVNMEDIAKPSSWAEEEVNKAKENELIDTEYVIFYREYITREDFAKLIVTCVDKLLGDKAVAITEPLTFSDTDSEDVKRATSMKIVSGIDDTTFAPYNEITRQEIAAMMYRAIDYVQNIQGKSYLKNNTDLSAFTDASSVSDWAKDSVGILVNNSIIFGTSDTTISPLSNTTVEQAILLDVRIFELMK